MEGAGVLAQVSLGPMLEPHPHPCLGRKGVDFQEKGAPTARQLPSVLITDLLMINLLMAQRIS